MLPGISLGALQGLGMVRLGSARHDRAPPPSPVASFFGLVWRAKQPSERFLSPPCLSKRILLAQPLSENQNERGKGLRPLSIIATISITIATLVEAAKPDCPSEYQRYFRHFSDARSLPDRLYHALGFERDRIGRSHALIAGVSNYPEIPEQLPPARADIEKIETWLRNSGHFDEIVVLHNNSFNVANLNYFLREYFPQRLQTFPKSRFLFAFSGHGIQQGRSSYLLTPKSRTFKDTARAIDMRELRVKLDKTLEAAYQSLVLINSCYSGAFVTDRSFGERSYIPQGPGAHAITAGRANERVFADSNFGTGSYFFETILSGLQGRADLLPRHPEGASGNGVISITELFTYLDEVIGNRYGTQVNPIFADLDPRGSQGGFFFFTPDAEPKRIEQSRTLKTGVPFGTSNRFESISSNRVRDRELECDWVLYPNGNYLSWNEALDWCQESELVLPSPEELLELTDSGPESNHSISQLLSLFKTPRTPEVFWTSTRKGFYREALRLVPGPPKLQRRNPADKCGVLARSALDQP